MIDRTKHIEIPQAVKNKAYFCYFQILLVCNTIEVKDYSDKSWHRYSLTVPNHTMKAGRCHINVKGKDEGIEYCERHKSSQDKYPPVLVPIWILHTTEIE